MVTQNYLSMVKGSEFVKDSIITPKDFIGPSSTTLQIANISEVNPDSNIVNIDTLDDIEIFKMRLKKNG